MTTPQETLQELIAGLLDMAPEQVTPDLSLNAPKFRGSVGAAILSGAIVSRLGRRINTQGVKTYGELLAAVTGEPYGSGSPAAAGAERNAGGGERIGALAAAGLNWEFISCGTDIEQIAIFPETNDYWNHEFYQEHFTPEEIAYCVSQAAPKEHFAARWCAKEALKKTSSRWGNLPFSQIQVGKRPDGSVTLQLRRNNAWVDAACRASLSHTPQFAIAMVIAFDAAASGGDGTGERTGGSAKLPAATGDAPVDFRDGKQSAADGIDKKKKRSLLKRFLERM